MLRKATKSKMKNIERERWGESESFRHEVESRECENETGREKVRRKRGTRQNRVRTW